MKWLWKGTDLACFPAAATAVLMGGFLLGCSPCVGGLHQMEGFTVFQICEHSCGQWTEILVRVLSCSPVAGQAAKNLLPALCGMRLPLQLLPEPQSLQPIQTEWEGEGAVFSSWNRKGRRPEGDLPLSSVTHDRWAEISVSSQIVSGGVCVCVHVGGWVWQEVGFRNYSSVYVLPFRCLVQLWTRPFHWMKRVSQSSRTLSSFWPARYTLYLYMYM